MLKLDRLEIAPIDEAINNLRAFLTNKESTMIDASESILGTESFGPEAMQGLDSHHEILKGHLREVFAERAAASLGTESFSTREEEELFVAKMGAKNEVQLDAMAQAIMVCSDKDKLSKLLGSHIGTEAFESTSITAHLSLTVGLAGAMAADINDAEFLFPSIVVDQNTTNYTITCYRTVVEPKFYHSTTAGEVTDWGKMNLLNANVIPDMLRSDLNVFIPEYSEATKDHFVSTDYVTPWEIEAVNGDTITSTFLANGGKEVNIITISTLTGKDNNTSNTILDRIDEGAFIKGLILGIGPVTAKQAIYVDSISINRSAFTRSIAETHNDVRALSMGDSTHIINLSKYVAPENGKFPALADITPLAALLALGYSKIGFKVSSTYELNLGTGTYVPGSAAPVVTYLELSSAVGVNQLKEEDFSDATYVTAVAPLFLGSDIHATLSNVTLKGLSDQVGNEASTKLFTLRVRTPVEIRTDVVSELSDSEKVNMMSQLLTYRRCNETVEELHEWFDWAVSALGHEGIHDSAREDLNIPCLHYLLKPYVKEIEIDLIELLKEVDTTGKLPVIQSGIVTVMQNEFLKMIKATNHREVVQRHGTDSKWVTKMGIFIDSHMANYIMRDGEERTFGDGIVIQEKAKIHATDRISMNDLIYAFPMAKSYESKRDRIFGFGHAIELTPIVVSRKRDSGIAFNQVLIWPIYENIITNPQLLRFKILGLDEYLSTAGVDAVRIESTVAVEGNVTVTSTETVDPDEVVTTE